MQKFSALILILIYALAPSARAKGLEPLLKCSEYTFAGKLSDDLTAPPILSTFSTDGIATQIQVESSDVLSIRLTRFHGKNVRARLLIKEQTGPRSYVGILKEVKLTPPPGLGAGKGNELAQFLAKSPDCK